MNYYPFHIGDYASATRHLTWDEDMAYRRLIDAYYTREEAIPKDERTIFRLVQATTEAQRDAVLTVLREFFIDTGSAWVHSRCEAEISVSREKSEKATKSALSRWKNANASKTDANASKNDATNTPVDGISCVGSRGHANASGINANASENICERIKNGCEGNATKTNTKTNVSKPKGLDSGAKRGSEIPESFCPNEKGTKYALDRGLLIGEQMDAFTNYHLAKGSVFKDWQAAWRTWCDKAVQFGKSSKSNGESFFERDQRSKADRISQFTGQAPRPAGNVIDVTPSAKLIGGAK